MKGILIAPLAAALALAACGGSEKPGGGNAFERAVAQAEAERREGANKPNETPRETSPPAPQIDPNTPADQFVSISNATECLGLAWNLTDDRDNTRSQMASAIGDSRFRNESDPFAMKDAYAEAEPKFEEMSAPYANKSLLVYKSTKGQTDLMPYDMASKSFNDRGGLTGIVDQMLHGPGTCSFAFTNKDAWGYSNMQGGNTYQVPDESQARAISAQIASKNVYAKYFFHAYNVNNSKYDWPIIEGTLLRIELGNL